MAVKINTNNFFKKYIVKPFAPELSEKHRLYALALSILVGIPTLGICQILAYLNLRNRRITVENLHNVKASNLEKIINKTDFVFQSAMNDESFPIKKEEIPDYVQKLIQENQDTDHASRAAIFAQIFLYLYEKYHPDYDAISMEQQVAAPLAAVAQDEELLKEAGIENEELLEEIMGAIADKENDDLKNKELIAKCVQNADSAEDARHVLVDQVQDKVGFKQAKKSFDIYKELDHLSNGKKGFVLKKGRTFEDFVEELDAIRIEMNQLIYETQQKKVPAKYSELFSEITEAKYPLLSYVTQNIGIKTKHNPKVTELQNMIQKVKTEVSQGKSFLSLDNIEQMIINLRNLSLDSLNADDKMKIEVELEPLKKMLREERGLRKFQIESFINLLEGRRRVANLVNDSSALYALDLKIPETGPVDLDFVVCEYGKLVPTAKDHVRDAFLKKLGRRDIRDRRRLVPQKYLSAAIADIEHKGLKNLISYEFTKLEMEIIELETKIIRLNKKEKALKEKLEKKKEELVNKKISHAKKLCKKTLTMLELYNQSDECVRDTRIQTTCALAFEKVCSLYIECEEFDKALEVLKEAGEKIKIEKNHPINMLNLEEWKNNSYKFFLFDSSFIRKRRVRLAEKHIGNQELMELSFELPSKIRTALTDKLKLFQNDDNDDVKVSLVDTNYERMDYEGDKFLDGDCKLNIGKDIKLELSNPKVTILIGNDKDYWNQYHLIRVRYEKGTSVQDVHKALSQIGLPMSLMQSREEDIRNEAFNRIIAMRYPKLVYKDTFETKGEVKRTPSEIKKELTDEQKKLIDEDLKAVELKRVGPDQLELVHTALPKEAWEKGARALGTFINAGNISKTSQVLGMILKSSILSSEERFMRGILGLGCAPRYNIQVGSGNQVFTRLLTKNFFEKKTELDKFAITGPIMILLDVQALERMPYSYLCDRGGLRNPHYAQNVFTPEKQKPIWNYKGWERLMDREGIGDLCDELSKNLHYLTETMFDTSLGPHYIKKLVVWNEKDRVTLMDTLEKMGIRDINGVKLEDAIVASNHLDPKMVENFNSETLA